MELSASRSMEKRLGQLLAEPYRHGSAGRFAKLAAGCTAGGAAVVAIAGRKRLGSLVGGGLLLAGSVFERFAVYKAGVQSASDPKYTVVPQRERAARMGTRATTRPSAEPNEISG